MAKKPVQVKHGRSLWAFKPRDISRDQYRREIRRKFERFTLSKVAASALEIKKRGVKSLSRKELIQFLQRNSSVAAKAINEGGQVGLTKSLSAIRGHLTKFDDKNIFSMVDITVRHILQEESKALARNAESHILKYFVERQIPVKTHTQKEAFNAALSDYFQTHKVGLEQPIDLRAIEKIYLMFRHDLIMLDQFKAEQVNALFRKIFGKEKLTPNQKKAALKLVRVADKLYDAKKDTIIQEMKPLRSQMSQLDYLQELTGRDAKALEQIVEDVKKQAQSTFQQVGGVKAPAKKSGDVRKLGTRAERMAAYIPGEKLTSVKRREFREQQIKERQSEGFFDSIKYALSEIEKENQSAATTMRELLSKRVLSRQSIAGLYKAGSLTQKVFLYTINNPGFSHEFRGKSIDLLARGLSFIGPTGKLTVRARRAFQGMQTFQIV